MTNDDPLEDALERAPLVLDRPLLFLCHAAFDSEGALRLGRQCYGWCEGVRVEEPTTPVVFNGLGLAERCTTRNINIVTPPNVTVDVQVRRSRNREPKQNGPESQAAGREPPPDAAGH